MSRDYLNFATRAADKYQRTVQWQDITHAKHVALGDDREASIRGCDLGDVRVCAVSIGEHILEHHADGLSSLGDNGLIKLLFIETGACEVNQGGRTALIHAGQWCAIDKTQPFRMSASKPVSQLAIALPKRLIRSADSIVGRLVVPHTFLNGAASILHCSVSHAIKATVGMGRRDRKLLGDAITVLINFAWNADPICHSSNSQHARRIAVIEFIDRNISDPELDVGRIAEGLGYAKRTLHKLFSAEGDTLSRIIWQKRLDHCRRDLLDPAQVRRSITEIAFSWGFSDAQHFSRSFKARFGMPPREYRSEHVAN